MPTIPPLSDAVNHPAHYGGADNPFEPIKVIHSWGLGFNLGSTLKYIRRAGHKPGANDVEDLEKALFYLKWEIEARKRSSGGTDDPKTPNPTP